MKGIGTAALWVFFATLVGVWGLFAVPGSHADEGDPSDVWLRAYMVMREGEVKEEEKRDLEALAKYREAQRLFDFLARTHPTWKSNMIQFRRKALLDKIDEVHSRLKGVDPKGEQEYRAQNAGVVATAPAPGASRNAGITVPSNPEVVPAPGAGITAAVPKGSAPPTGGAVPPVESISQEFTKLQAQMDQLSGANQRLMVERDQRQQAVSALESQLEQSRQVEQQLRTQLTKALDDLKTAQNAGSERQRQLEAQLQAATAELRQANSESARILKVLEAAKLEVAELTKQKNALLASREGDMEKVSQALAQLEQTAGDRDKARAERDAAREELKRLQEEKGKPEKPAGAASSAGMVAGQSDAGRENEELVAKLEEQAKGDPALKARNEELVAELKKSQETISTLNAKVHELERSNQQLQARQDELIKERDLLRKERDEMAILLKAGDQVKGDVADILEANGTWRKQLEEANRRTYELQDKEGNYQREIEQLRGQLTAMQQERELLRTENHQYQQTVSELEGKLSKILTELDQKTKALEALAAGRAGSGDAGVIVGGKIYTKEELETMAGAREENDLLRGIIRDQLVQQAKAQHARQLVLQELEKMDYQSELLLTSLDDMTGQQVKVSPELKKMFKGTAEMKLIEVVDASQADEKKFASLKTGQEIQEAKQKRITQFAKAANYDFMRKAYDKAKNGYEQILTIEPNNVFALANMGLIHAQSGDPSKAKEYLEKALKCDQTHAPTYYYLGLLHFKQGEYGPAMDAFGRCLTHDQKNANAHFYLGLIAKEKGWLPRAETEFNKVVELNPKDANAHFNLAVIYTSPEKMDKALARKHYKLARDLGAAADSAMDACLASK